MGVGYTDTFIAVADDCPVETGTPPAPGRGGAPTTATVQFALVHEHPHRYTSEDLIFEGSTLGRSLAEAPDEERAAAREAFFAKPQACLRASPLPKRWGWGLHFDADGRVALVALGTPEYERLAAATDLRQLKAMRTRRA